MKTKQCVECGRTHLYDVEIAHLPQGWVIEMHYGDFKNPQCQHCGREIVHIAVKDGDSFSHLCCYQGKIANEMYRSTPSGFHAYVEAGIRGITFRDQNGFWFLKTKSGEIFKFRPVKPVNWFDPWAKQPNFWLGGFVEGDKTTPEQFISLSA